MIMIMIMKNILVKSLLFPLFQGGTRHLLSPTSAVSTNWPNFHMEVQILSRVDLRRRQEGEQCVCGELVALADIWNLDPVDKFSCFGIY